MVLAQIESNEFAIIIILAAILWLALILTALYHISRNRQMGFSVKALWFIIILFAPFLGSIIYLIWGKNKHF
ncbi:PLD nuclease N-terminal domain-containing protein [Pedobacter rhodius]|uniref:PLD nuclease N-terminal domain-containing protein n=1 Tax=Pedobacter rhodius TaxID=3004098 RepID=A0ABT4KXU4_9SPHI|nr:PLD nuclease N-terminal domain-containing protein [Pedobacter sp. SJ11]MCZ4223747.1 PLD nuclease N-terminal domain-containing protein [Pedobacter sp. SJ11]